MNKTNKIIYWVLSGVVALALAGSALFKLSGGEQAAEMAKNLGGTTNLIILAIIELTIVVLWFIKRTGVLATVLAIAYFGGAIAVNFVTSQPVVVPVIIQTIIWIAGAFRFPELTQRLINNSYGIKQ